MLLEVEKRGKLNDATSIPNRILSVPGAPLSSFPHQPQE